jgi:uncharacterized membrane protein
MHSGDQLRSLRPSALGGSYSIDGYESPAKSPSRNRWIRALWGLLAFLSLLGIIGAAMRAYVVTTMTRMPVAARPALAPIDQRNLAIVKAARHVTPGSTEDAKLERDMAHLATRYNSHPVYTFLHLGPGVLILLLAPFQFSRRIRSRHLRAHRWSGRTILVAGIATAISAVYFGIVNPHVPRMEPVTIGVMTAVFVFAGTRGYLAIRRRDIERHREWMTRMYAIAVGIGMVRLVAFPITFGFPRMDPGLLLMLTFWVGWLLTVAGAELWIRHSRKRGLSPA